MAAIYNSQNPEWPTNMAAEQQHPPFIMNSMKFMITILLITYLDSLTQSCQQYKRILSPPSECEVCARCFLPVDTKPLSCHSGFWLRFLFSLCGLCLCPGYSDHTSPDFCMYPDFYLALHLEFVCRLF